MALAPGVPPYRFGDDDPNWAEDDLVTTQMCAAVHLDHKFANFVARQLGTLPHTAVWPNLKLDYVMLFRHANFSRGRRALRDLELVLWMLGLIITWVVIAWQLVVGNITILAALLAVLAVTAGVFLGAGVIVWFFYEELRVIVTELTEQPEVALARLDDFPGLPSRPAGLPPQALSPAQQTARRGTIYALARIMSGFHGWTQGVREELRARSRELAGRPAQREKSTQNPVAHLSGLGYANVLLFDRTMKPFDLAGIAMDSWQITIDVSKRVNPVQDTPAVSPVALHHRLLDCVPDGSMPRLDARSLYVVSGLHPVERDLFDHWRRCVCVCDCDCAGNTECACGCRAALAGDSYCGPSQQWLAGEAQSLDVPPELTGEQRERWVAQALAGPIEQRLALRNPNPDPRSLAGERNNPEGWYLEHPEYVVNEADIDTLIEGPPEGGRVYAYFRKYSWRGQVVVGAAVRVYRALNTLYIEFDSHVMPPLSQGFDNYLELPVTDRTIRKALWRTTVARTPSLLFQSLRSMYMLYFRPTGRTGVLRELQAKREEEGRIDYGSSVNLRLETADRDRLYHFPYVDELDHADVLRDRVIDCIEEYLQSCLVDPGEYQKKVWLIRTRKNERRRRSDPSLPPGAVLDD